MLELELLQRSQRAIALFQQLQPTPLVVIELVEDVGLGLRLAKERKRDHDDTRDGQRRSEQEAQRQGATGRPACEARVTRRRCSRRSGQSVMTEPRRKTRPASQMRLTSGFTKTRK